MHISSCLNPYSTGSNSNKPRRQWHTKSGFVLILILLEVTQINNGRYIDVFQCLNPYSTGSNSNYINAKVMNDTVCLNLRSTGSNSNIAATTNINAQENTVLILILLEVTQILRISQTFPKE